MWLDPPQDRGGVSGYVHVAESTDGVYAQYNGVGRPVVFRLICLAQGSTFES